MSRVAVVLLLLAVVSVPTVASAAPARCRTPGFARESVAHRTAFVGIEASIDDHGGLFDTTSTVEFAVRFARGEQRVDHVEFSLTPGIGPLSAETPTPFGVRLTSEDGPALPPARYELRAVIVAKDGLRSTISFRFYVSRCDLAAVSVSAGRTPAGPIVRVSAFGGSAGLSRFVLRRPSSMHPDLERVLPSARLGSLEVSGIDGFTAPLIRPDVVRESTVVLRSSSAEVRFARSGLRRAFLAVRSSFGSGFRLTLRDAGLRALGLPRRCRNLRFDAVLVGAAGVARGAGNPILTAAAQRHAGLCS